ncbi:MAG: AraC family transcriptional regulator [Sphingobacteriales bacterium]|nr:MAG: AraC family transcriptional regulator [Sphingobacteriales bacterium]
MIPIRNIHSTKESSSGRFNIRKVEDILNGNDLQHNLHRHNFFFILAVQTGEGTHEIDFVRHAVVNQSVFLLRPGQVHQLQLKAGTKGYLMEFDNEFYHPTNESSKQRLRKANSKTFCQLDDKRFERLHAVLSTIFDEYTNQLEGYQDAVKANLEVFYIEYVRQSPEPKGNAKGVTSYVQERFDEFLELLETHIITHKLVSQYTDLMLLSQYQLNEITKASVGKTASELIDQHILLEAKRYLLATTKQIKDIAWDLGYEDISYFIRFFKKHTGHSPDAFRKNFK